MLCDMLCDYKLSSIDHTKGAQKGRQDILKSDMGEVVRQNCY